MVIMDLVSYVPRYPSYHHLDASGGMRSIDECGNFGITSISDVGCVNLK
jgi:hypothetical protein